MPVAYAAPAPDRDEPLAQVKGCSANGSNDSSSDVGLDIAQEEMRELLDRIFVRDPDFRCTRVGGGGGIEMRPKCGGGVFM